MLINTGIHVIVTKIMLVMALIALRNLMNVNSVHIDAQKMENAFLPKKDMGVNVGKVIREMDINAKQNTLIHVIWDNITVLKMLFVSLTVSLSI